MLSYVIFAFVVLAKIWKGCILFKINLSKINSTEELTQIYSQIKAGEKVELTMLRKEKEVLLTFEKPESGCGGKPFKVMKKQGQ